MKPTLITLADFLYQVDISQQTPEKKINPIIWKTERFKLAPVICKPLYDELLEQSEASTLTVANQTLIDDYITPYVVEYAYSRYLKESNTHGTISGMSFIQGDNTGDISENKTSDLIKTHEYDAESFKATLVSFLSANVDTYPLYTDCCVKQSSSSFMFGSVQSAEQKYYAELDKYIRDGNSNWQNLDNGECC